MWQLLLGFCRALLMLPASTVATSKCGSDNVRCLPLRPVHIITPYFVIAHLPPRRRVRGHFEAARWIFAAFRTGG
jgi:hypothetical protein